MKSAAVTIVNARRAFARGLRSPRLRDSQHPFAVSARVVVRADAVVCVSQDETDDDDLRSTASRGSDWLTRR